LIALIFAAIVLPVWSNPIDESTARKVAIQTLSRSVTSQGGADLQLLCISSSNSEYNVVNRAVQTGEIVYFYVFGTKDNDSFTIVAGDDRVTPVLGYSDTNGFSADNLPDNLAWWLGEYAKQIQFAIENDIKPTTEIKRKWAECLSTNSNNMEE